MTAMTYIFFVSKNYFYLFSFFFICLFVFLLVKFLCPIIKFELEAIFLNNNFHFRSDILKSSDEDVCKAFKHKLEMEKTTHENICTITPYRVDYASTVCIIYFIGLRFIKYSYAYDIQREYCTFFSIHIRYILYHKFICI